MPRYLNVNIKKSYSKITKVISIMLAASILSGCSLTTPFEHLKKTAEVVEETEQITSLGLEPDLNYEKPTIEAHIEIDQVGYNSGDNKIAVFRGKNLSDEFNLISADTGEIVYTGEIREKSISGTDKTYFYGDFSDFTRNGKYYVQTDVIGYSYSFEIGDRLYDGMLKEALKQFYVNRCGMNISREYAGENSERTACHTEPVTLQQDANVQLDVSGGWHVAATGDRKVITGCNSIEALLLAYEYNSQVFTDDFGIPESGDGIPDILNEIKYETDWLLKMQNQTTGGVYSSVSVVDQGKGAENPCHIEDVDMSATLSFASALGYFSYLYQVYDTAYATTCLKAADRAMKYAAKFPDTVNQDEYFRAATYLYRATGYGNYSNIILNYCKDKTEYDISDNKVFAGIVTYLATKQKTNAGICAVMMKNLKSYAESMSADRKDALFLMGEETKAVEHSALLPEIARLTVVNYIISSNEYEKIMEKYLHYFLGCNPENTCFVGQYGSTNTVDNEEVASRDILKRPELDAIFVILVSGITSKEEGEKQ